MRTIITVVLALTMLLAVAGTFSIVGLAHDEPTENDDHEACEETTEMSDDCPVGGGTMESMNNEMDEDCPMDDEEMMHGGMMAASETGCH